MHPNDDVNRGQSSNDVFPTAMHVAAVEALRRARCCPRSRGCATTLAERSEAFAAVVKIGRTHLQDATPLTLGQEFSGYVAQLDHGIAHVEAALPHLSRAGARRHRGRHRPQRASANSARGWPASSRGSPGCRS